MIDDLSQLVHAHRESAYLFLRHLQAQERRSLLWSDLVRELDDFTETEAGAPLRGTGLEAVIRRTQEALFAPSMIYLAVREEVASWRYVQIHVQEMLLGEISVSEYLEIKERSVLPGRRERYALEVDLTPFERGFPRVTSSDEIGCGVDFLNRHLCERLAGLGRKAAEQLYDFLRVHQVDGRPLMLNELVRNGEELKAALAEADTRLARMNGGNDWTRDLRRLGFEPGWGRTPAQAREMMQLLADVLEEPTPDALARFLARVPMIFSVAIISPHGYFGQADVLGKPDTGGQVVYILDQVRALERAMRASIHEQGLSVTPHIVVVTRLIPDAGETTCDQRLEPILGTENARILRVPFRDERLRVVPEWISRFEVWPYLERFAVEAQRELEAEMGGRPDIVIGNYSDGNLVASILAHRLGVTQCNIAHALEKAKYLHSDLHWKEMEAHNHFSCQFTADLIAMNTADFVITSTYQEIAGTDESVGQYESYQAFSLPGLYRVISGIDCFDPKFNILSPGADAETFFPFTERGRRPRELTEEIEALVYGEPDTRSRGQLVQRDKPIIFAMSRLDRVKNTVGLLEWYLRSPELQDVANLLVVGGRLDPGACKDRDERQQAQRMHDLMDRHGPDVGVRWLEMQTDKNTVGGLYRCVADTRGLFVQPALFEAFGLTVVEAMSSGLPVFATRYGGPLEIVEHGVSGFHIDPTTGDEAAAAMADFLRRSAEDPGVWEKISEGALRRVRERYTWERYAGEFLRLSRIYGYWRHITTLERQETRRYLEMFYGLMYRRRAETVRKA
jgi:sucrose synthase